MKRRKKQAVSDYVRHALASHAIEATRAALVKPRF